MLYVSLIFELLRARPRLMFWTAALAQALLWVLVPALFYWAPPGDVPIVLAVGHEFQLGTDFGPPLAFWLADIAFRLGGGIFGVYLLAQACVVVTLWGIFALGCSILGTFHAVLAVLLMVGIVALSMPTPEFGPALLAMPIWTVILLHYWRAVGEGRKAYWVLLAIEMGLLLLTSYLGFLLLALLVIFTATTAQGRAVLRGSDPWICAAVALVVALPYLAWLGHAQDIWLPALSRLPSTDTNSTAMEWARIFAAFVGAHVGIAFLLLAVLVFMGIVSLWTPLSIPRIAQRWFSTPNIFYLWPVPLATALTAFAAWRGLERGSDALPFLAAIGLFLLGYLGLVISSFPYLVPPSLTVWETAAAPESQIFMLVGTLVLLPIILGYTALVYWVFRGKLREGEGYH